MPADLRYLDWKVVYLEEQRRGQVDLSGVLGRSTERSPRRFRRRYETKRFLRGVRWNDQHGAYDADPAGATRKLRP